MQFLRNIAEKELFKVTSLNSVSVLLKIGVGFITAKVIAIFVGPAGMALVGNLRNFITSVENLATFGFQYGIVKYTAEKKSDEIALKTFQSTVAICLALLTLITSLSLYFAAGWLNASVFGLNYQYASVFRILAIGLPWYVGSIFLLSILNGLGGYRKVIYINILGNVLSLLFSVVLIFYYGTFGALLSLIVAPSFLFFVCLYFVRTAINFSRLFAFSNFRLLEIRNLLQYSLMAGVSSILGPMAILSIRQRAIATVGIDQAGYWEAMTRISSYYLLFLSTILGVYFLPRLSRAVSGAQTKIIFKTYFTWMMPAFGLMLAILYLVKVPIIHLLFTNDFEPVATLFFWQLIGDFFKAASLILGYQLIAKKMTAAYIATELFSFAVLWCSSVYLLSLFGIEGTVMAHALTYAVYFTTLSVFFKIKLR